MRVTKYGTLYDACSRRQTTIPTFEKGDVLPPSEWAFWKEVLTNVFSFDLFYIGVECQAIGEQVNDAKLPYERVTPKPGETMIATTSHMVSLLFVLSTFAFRRAY